MPTCLVGLPQNCQARLYLVRLLQATDIKNISLVHETSAYLALHEEGAVEVAYCPQGLRQTEEFRLVCGN